MHIFAWLSHTNTRSVNSNLGSIDLTKSDASYLIIVLHATLLDKRIYEEQQQ